MEKPELDESKLAVEMKDRSARPVSQIDDPNLKRSVREEGSRKWRAARRGANRNRRVAPRLPMLALRRGLHFGERL